MNTNKNDIINLRVYDQCLKLTKKTNFEVTLAFRNYEDYLEKICRTYMCMLCINFPKIRSLFKTFFEKEYKKVNCNESHRMLLENNIILYTCFYIKDIEKLIMTKKIHNKLNFFTNVDEFCKFSNPDYNPEKDFDFKRNFLVDLSRTNSLLEPCNRTYVIILTNKQRFYRFFDISQSLHNETINILKKKIHLYANNEFKLKHLDNKNMFEFHPESCEGYKEEDEIRLLSRYKIFDTLYNLKPKDRNWLRYEASCELHKKNCD